MREKKERMQGGGKNFPPPPYGHTRMGAGEKEGGRKERRKREDFDDINF